MLPKDPVMLLSVINMKLRDMYPSLNVLAEDMDEDAEAIKATLAKLQYVYDEGINQFVCEE